MRHSRHIIPGTTHLEAIKRPVRTFVAMPASGDDAARRAFNLGQRIKSRLLIVFKKTDAFWQRLLFHAASHTKMLFRIKAFRKIIDDSHDVPPQSRKVTILRDLRDSRLLDFGK
jgi:hypothetical protein